MSPQIETMKKHQAWLNSYLSQLPLSEEVLEKLETDILRRIYQALSHQKAELRELAQMRFDQTISNYGGKLPFVVNPALTQEEQRIAYYKQGMDDVLSLLSEPQI